MSRGVPADPVITRSGTTKIAIPSPVRGLSIPIDPVCSQFSGAITVTPDPPPSR